MFDCKKIVVVGISQLNHFNLWQIQVLMGSVTPIACFTKAESCPDLPEGFGILFLTERKPELGQVTRFKHVFHAPIRPCSAPTLELSRLECKPGGQRYWAKAHEACLPTKRRTAGEIHLMRPKPKPRFEAHRLRVAAG
jgi:hypothetical protein